MKVARLTSILISLTVMCMILGPGQAVQAYSQEEIVPILTTVIDESEQASKNLTANSSAQEITSSFSSLSSTYSNGSQQMASLTPEGESQQVLQQKLISTLDKLASISNTVATTNDNAAYTTALTDYDTETAALNAEIQEVNAMFNLSTSDYSGALWVLVVIFGLISICLLIASKSSNKLLKSAVAQDALQFELFKSSLWPTFGSIVSLVWYSMTPPGGTYVLLWGPIGVGALVFVRNYVHYTKQKKELKKMKKEETENIQHLTQHRKHSPETDGESKNTDSRSVSSASLQEKDMDRKELIGIGFRHRYGSMFMSDESYNSLDEKKRAQLYQEGLKINESSPQETEEAISDEAVDTASSDTTNAKMEIIRVGFKRINNINPSDDDLIKMPDRALEHYYKIGLKHISK